MATVTAFAAPSGPRYRKIIDGKRYDTATATLIGEGGSREYRNDFHWYEAGLYKTKSGRFFIAGKGNAMSMFSHYNGNTYGPGEGVIAMTKEEALDWAEEHLSVEEIEAGFPGTIEDA